MILLTDGRVMVQEEATKHWHALTPVNGSYQNGTWSTLADMSIWRRYYASAVLKDGRVVVCGGEQSGGGGDTTVCEIYDPVADTWSIIPSPPGWSQVGDATCCLFPDGRLMIGALLTGACAIYNPATNSWAPGGSKAIRSNEESWVLLADNTILTVQCFAPYQSEKYNIATNTWHNEGAIPTTIVDSVMAEIGPAMLMYNGKVIYFGAANTGGHGKTIIYTPPANPANQGTWAVGPDIPNVGGKVIVCNDCPASLLPNGHVLFTAANFLNNNWGSPVLFFEYDPVANTITQAPTPPNNNAQLYWSRLMLLPTGEVMFSPSSNNVQVYVPGGAPQAAWRPTITSVTAVGVPWFTNTFSISGTQLNGLSQGNMYGDDCYPCTNYPIVRLVNTATGHVYFGRTHDFSTMGVATGATPESARFTLSGVPFGTYNLTVIANGISSVAVPFSYYHLKIVKEKDVLQKALYEQFGKELVEGDPLNPIDPIIDPTLVDIQSQIKSLQNSVQRLTSLIPAQALPAVGKEVTKAAAAEASGGGETPKKA